jgi:hypothetical protein
MAGAVGVGLYPLALAVLVLSRAYGVARAAAVPRVRPSGVGLVSANARMNVAAVTAGAAAAALGSGLSALAGSAWVLRLASVVLIVGGVLALRLPPQVDEPPSPHERRVTRFRLSDTGPQVTGPLSAAVALRAVAGLLTLFLAFLLRREDASGLLVAAVLAAAALGQLSGTGLAARLPESGDQLLARVALGLPFAGCLGAAIWPTGGWIVAAAGATGVSVSLSKFAADAAVQAHVARRSLSTAFARSETALQVAWVVGGGLALAIPTVASVGFAAAALLPVLGLVLAHRLAQRAASQPAA